MFGRVSGCRNGARLDDTTGSADRLAAHPRNG
jgi:hypothetical protein